MADFQLPDDIICNIIARLPAKPLLRFGCLSRYWYRKLREPNFMKLRSRKSIILSLVDTLKFIDDTSNLIVERCHPFDTASFKVTVIGTLNGLVLLGWLEYFIVYNPLTGEYSLLTRCPWPRNRLNRFGKEARGFGYGATPDDLKIVRFKMGSDTCEVYSFSEDSWSRLSMSKYRIFMYFEYPVGCFVNGFLYWISHHRNALIAVNVKDMAFSEICTPFKIRRGDWMNPLGTMDGNLCSLQPITNNRFDMWVMKEDNLWSIIYSFELVGVPLHDIYPYYFLCILENRRLLMWGHWSENLIIYDTSKGSYKTLNISFAQ